MGGDYERINYHLWNCFFRYNGYCDWAIPFQPDDPYGGMMRIMQTQMIYGGFSKKDLEYPEIQVKKLFAAPFERALAERSKSKEHLRLQSKIFVLKYSLTPFITSYEKEWEDRLTDATVRAWRLISCFGETNLDTLHDRILGPAMGWCRHFHTYKYIIPTNGACFGPETSAFIARARTKISLHL